MKLLVLGGTLFLGRAVVEAALAREHTVTLFHRGRTQAELFPQCEHLLGDRDGGLDVLDGRRWDAVVDTSGYVPRVVRASAAHLAAATAHYTFVSSISVYPDTSRPGLNEESPVATIDDATREDVTGETYGALKALCERAVEAEFPGRSLTVRPGLIVGPHDSTDRFTWWPRRFARGGEVLAPGSPDAPVQLVDVRDLAVWMLAMTERAATGTFNATGPDTPLTLGTVLETCRNVAGGVARVTWVDEAFLLERGVQPWTDLPLWLPATDAGFQRIDCTRAWRAGLTFRPLADTARDTLAWDRATPLAGRPKKPGVSFPTGITPEREAALLEDWHRRTTAATA